MSERLSLFTLPLLPPQKPIIYPTYTTSTLDLSQYDDFLNSPTSSPKTEHKALAAASITRASSSPMPSESSNVDATDALLEELEISGVLPSSSSGMCSTSSLPSTHVPVSSHIVSSPLSPNNYLLRHHALNAKNSHHHSRINRIVNSGSGDDNKSGSNSSRSASDRGYVDSWSCSGSGANTVNLNVKRISPSVLRTRSITNDYSTSKKGPYLGRLPQTVFATVLAFVGVPRIYVLLGVAKHFKTEFRALVKLVYDELVKSMLCGEKETFALLRASLSSHQAYFALKFRESLHITPLDLNAIRGVDNFSLSRFCHATSNSESTYRVVVKAYMNNSMHVLDCDHSCTVGYLKRMVQQHAETPADSQILVYDDQFLIDDSRSLSSHKLCYRESAAEACISVIHLLPCHYCNPRVMLSLRAQQQTLAQSHATPLLVLYSDASHTTYHTGVDAGYFQRVEEIKSFVESFHRQTHASAILASSVSFAHSAGSRGGGANDTNTITEAGDGHRGSGSGSVVQFDRMRFMNVFDWAPLTVTSMREGWLAQAVDHRYHVPVIVFVHM